MTPRDLINLRFWQGKGQNKALASLFDRWWDRLTEYLTWLTHQVDYENDPLELIDLLAWQRDITRLQDEDEELYRKRVKYALLNARDAGSKAGFARIWARLGLGSIEQTERFDDVEWDVIRLEVDAAVISRYNGLFDALLEQYGRTCRRYVFDGKETMPFLIRSAEFACDSAYCVATGVIPPWDDPNTDFNVAIEARGAGIECEFINCTARKS